MPAAAYGWEALWLDQWWANALIGVFTGLVYSFFAAQTTIVTGMLKPTPVGQLRLVSGLA